MAEQGYKRCKTCAERKPLDEFYPHKRLKDGYTNECKVCIRRHVSEWQKKNRKRANKRKLDWAKGNRERVAETKRRWAAEHPDRVKENGARMRELYPEKVRARNILNDAVRDGLVLKPSACEECGDEPEPRELQGHHEDYAKPLDVRWLCRPCHVEEHLED